MYQTARFPRPPGPFPWQSTRFLQRILVRSARLAKTWTSRRMTVVSSRRVFSEKFTLVTDHQWVSKRWRIGTQGTEIVSQDVDTGSQQTLLKSKSIICWAACSIICAQGHFIYLVLREGDGSDDDLVKLVEFQADDDSGHLSGPVVFNVPLRCSARNMRIRAEGTITPFVYISVDLPDEEHHWHLGRNLIFDIRSRIFYKFPRFTTQLDEMDPESESRYPDRIETLLTTTHIVVVSTFYLGHNMYAQVLQAFVVPDDPHPDSKGIYELRLSHENETNRHGMPRKLSLLRDSVVNPVDGSTTIRFLHSFEFQFFCTELFLPRSQTDSVVRMSLQEYQVLDIEIAFGRTGDNMLAVDSGFGRGLCIIMFRVGGMFAYMLYKFAIDASEEIVTAVVGRHKSPSSVGIKVFDIDWAVHWFDGVRGRICYTKRSDDRDGDSETNSLQVVTDVLDLE